MWVIVGTQNQPMDRADFDAQCVAYDESGWDVEIDDLFGDEDTQKGLANAGYGDACSRRILLWASEEESEQDDGTKAIAEATWSED